MANNDSVKPKLESYRSLPGTSRTAGALSGQRGTNRGDAVVAPIGKARSWLCEEGSYFLATNPTIGTGDATLAAADGYTATQAFLGLRNDNSDASGKYIVLDRLILTTTVAGTNGTDLTYAHHIDDIDRYSSGGTAVTPVNCNMASSTASGATMYSGDLTMTAAGNNVRQLDSGTLRTVITVVGDKYTLDFGGEAGLNAALATAGTAQCNLHVPVAPVVLGPGDYWIFAINAASQTVASQFEFRLSWWER